MTAKGEARDRSAEMTSSMEFSELILGFSSAALYYLGQSTVDGMKAPHVNLPLAKQNIEIVAMLEQKTRGNLTNEETALIKQVLADLRTKFKALEPSSKA